MVTFAQFLVHYFAEEGLNFTLSDCEEYIREMSDILINEGHYGDCTNQNVTCRICEFQNELDEYLKFIKT